MRNTPRLLNRLSLIVLGLVLLAFGLVIAVVPLLVAASIPLFAAVPGFIEQVTASTGEVLQATQVADTGHSWITMAVLGLIILAVIFIIVLLSRQGGGSTRRIAELAAPSQNVVSGAVRVQNGVAEDLLEHMLRERERSFVSVSVHAYERRSDTVLKITTTARKGASPARVASAVDEAVQDFQSLLGTELPAVIEITSSFRRETSKVA
ncbi:hypothetical protein [Humidisolicoccus flavus]|uniref:hypothetical protein n=1 Tax=Humidisolicoccus flavus TaxID=3111414 RepID=UPI003255736F